MVPNGGGLKRMITRRILLLTVRAGERPDWLDRAPGRSRIDTVGEAALSGLPPHQIAALLVPMHIDQRLFAANGAWIAAFLTAGGTLVFNGLLAYPFLPELRPFQPLTRGGLDALKVGIAAPPHPIFAGIDADHLTFRKGVAGFYGRGQTPPPPGARVLTTLDRGTVPLDWEWRRPGGGCVLMHPGNDLWMYRDDSTSAGRLVPQLLNWIVTGTPSRREVA